MVVYDPYASSYGKLMNVEKNIKELQKYLITSGFNNHNYEYIPNPKTKLVCIIGANQDEKDLIPLNHPLIFKDVRDQVTIAVDLRKYVKSVQDFPMNLSEVMKDKASCEFLINTALIISDFIAAEYGDYRKLYESMTSAFALFTSNIVNLLIALNPMEKLLVEIAVCYYANAMLTPGNDMSDYYGPIVARMAHTKLSLPTTKRLIEDTIKDIDVSEVSVSSLMTCIRTVLPEEKAGLIDETLFLNYLSNLTYLPGGNETLIIALDNVCVWMSVLYSSLADVTYKKSRFSAILDKNSRAIGGKEFVRDLELVLKSKMN